MSLWLYEYFWIILLFGHLVCFILKILAWKIPNMKWEFAKKVIIKSQRQFMYGSNFYVSDVRNPDFGTFWKLSIALFFNIFNDHGTWTVCITTKPYFTKKIPWTLFLTSVSNLSPHLGVQRQCSVYPRAPRLEF